MPVLAGIFKQEASDCSNGGFSQFYDRAMVYGPNEPFDPAVGARDAARGQCPVRLVPGNIGGLVKAVPIELDGSSRRGMFGGCFIASSNGLFVFRVAEVIGAQPARLVGAVPFHDRFE